MPDDRANVSNDHWAGSNQGLTCIRPESFCRFAVAYNSIDGQSIIWYCFAAIYSLAIANVDQGTFYIREG